MKSRNGFLITFEGPEGSGKSTQISLLAERLEGRGREVLRTREPGGTAVGEAIRGILQHDECGESPSGPAELFLFLASRAQIVHNVIAPAIERGAVVLCDRFADSTTAYQGYARGFDVEEVLLMNRFALQGMEPDLTILLDIEVEEGFRRLEKRNVEKNSASDRIEREAIEFHRRVRDGYLELAARWPGRFRIVDASGDSADVESAVWAHVDSCLRECGG